MGAYIDCNYIVVVVVCVVTVDSLNNLGGRTTKIKGILGSLAPHILHPRILHGSMPFLMDSDVPPLMGQTK